jgi:uncharacterized membrane protein
MSAADSLGEEMYGFVLYYAIAPEKNPSHHHYFFLTSVVANLLSFTLDKFLLYINSVLYAFILLSKK